MEHSYVFPHRTNASVGSSVTLGIRHRWQLAPDEIIRLHSVYYGVHEPRLGDNLNCGWALSTDANHDSMATDLNVLMSDAGMAYNQRVFARAHLMLDVATTGGKSSLLPVKIDLMGYDMGDELIVLFFNELGAAKVMWAELYYERARVPLALATTLRKTRGVHD